MIGLLGFSSIHNAALKGDIETIRHAHEKFGLDLDVKSSYGFTSLHFAAANGKISIVRYLIENGANINSKSDSKSTALDLAARYGNLRVAKYLIEQKADINVKIIKMNWPDFLKRPNVSECFEYLKSVSV